MSNEIPPHERALMTRPEAADFLSLHERTLRRFDEQGLMPGPVKVGRHRVRYRRDELIAWVHAGCPRMDDWKWEPRQLQTLDQIIKERRREFDSITRETSAATAELERLNLNSPDALAALEQKIGRRREELDVLDREIAQRVGRLEDPPTGDTPQ